MAVNAGSDMRRQAAAVPRLRAPIPGLATGTASRAWRFLALVLAAILVVAGGAAAVAHEEDDAEAEAEAGGLEVEIDRPVVMVGDPIEVEASFEAELDDEG